MQSNYPVHSPFCPRRKGPSKLEMVAPTNKKDRQKAHKSLPPPPPQSERGRNNRTARRRLGIYTTDERRSGLSFSCDYPLSIWYFQAYIQKGESEQKWIGKGVLSKKYRTMEAKCPGLQRTRQGKGNSPIFPREIEGSVVSEFAAGVGEEGRGPAYAEKGPFASPRWQ